MHECLGSIWQNKKQAEKITACNRTKDQTRELFDRVWNEKYDVWFIDDVVWIEVPNDSFDWTCFKWCDLRPDQYHKLKERERWQEEMNATTKRGEVNYDHR